MKEIEYYKLYKNIEKICFEEFGGGWRETIANNLGIKVRTIYHWYKRLPKHVPYCIKLFLENHTLKQENKNLLETIDIIMKGKSK